MRIATILGALLSLVALAVVLAVVTGAAEALALVALLPCVGGAVAAFSVRRMFVAQLDAERRVAELPTRGIRRRGEVRDAVPLSDPSGGAVFTPDGAQMVLQVALAAEGELPARTVTVHVSEPSEAARARIGQTVVVLEHPEAPEMRALQGFLPNGRPARPGRMSG